MKRVVFLDYLRVLAIFMVMVVHACEQYYFNSEGFYIASAGDAVWVSVLDSAVRACVPLFVMASAFLLFPVRGISSAAFLKRRVLRVFVPFAVWAAVYTVFWGGEWGQLAFNFPMMTSGHLWFIPMIIGLYLLMPLLSPWAEKVERRELQLWIALWLVTTLFPFARGLWRHLYGAPVYGSVPYIWGECPWNAFGTFHYVSGFFGYLLLGLYFRRFAADRSWARTLGAAVPVWLIGWVVTALPFLFRIPASAGYPVAAPYPVAVELEMSWDFCSLGPVLMTIALFSTLRKLVSDGAFYRWVVLPLSNASFGVYLLHMFVLVAVVGWFKPANPTPLAILATAVTTFAISSLISMTIRRVPFVGRWICG